MVEFFLVIEYSNCLDKFYVQRFYLNGQGKGLDIYNN